MKTLKLAVLAIVLLFIPTMGYAQQNTLTQTTTSSAVTNNTTNVALASCTGITVGTNSYNTYLYIDRELLTVIAVNTSPCSVSVLRGAEGTRSVAHAASTMVLAGRPNWFIKYQPQGSCVLANVIATPIVDATTGNQWLCSSVTLTVVPGFWNAFIPAASAVTAAVASAAGTITPSGPLFHVTGTAAITGFVQPVGCNATVRGGCTFTIIPDAVFTWTAAGNIALAGTAVVNKQLTFTWDATNSKWIPSYIA